MSVYFQKKILAIAEQLSRIGKPAITILLPSNEAFYEDMWLYRQSRDQREKIINRAVMGIQQAFESYASDSFTITAMRWDDYLRAKGIDRTPDDYSRLGEQLLYGSPEFPRIQAEAVRNGVAYFQEKGISVDPALIASRRIRYYGVYVGEGLALQELQDYQGVVIFNFEEWRVSQMELLGAGGQLPIVTPINADVMSTYYQWIKAQGGSL